MRPRAFLEPAFRVPYRPQIPGNGTPRFLLFTTKRTRNGQDLRWMPCPLRIEFDHLFVQSAKTSPTSSLNLFIYLLFFGGGGGGDQENFGTFGESFLAHTHNTEFNSSTQVFRSWRSSCSWSFETRIYIFYESREELSIVRRKNRSLGRDSITLEFCINFH